MHRIAGIGEKSLSTVLHVSQYSHGIRQIMAYQIYQVYNFEMHANF